MLTTIDDCLLARMDADWYASNYLSVSQIYLLDNPRLKEPRQPRSLVLLAEPDGLSRFHFIN